jgi:glycosyltransferase involved in cell wall biosynthesis
MADSVHLANWLQNMRGLPFDLTLISSSPHRKIHPKIIELLGSSKGRPLKVNIPWWSQRFGLMLWALDVVLSNRLRGYLTRKVIKKTGPDLIHVVEFQHAGYILLRAVSGTAGFPIPLVLASNYGSDIYWFQRFSQHKAKIMALLHIANFYTSECNRDLALAAALGFKGKSTVIPNTGGINEKLLLGELPLAPTSERKTIVLKGYHNKFGQALFAVGALWRVRRQLSGFKVVSVSTNLITAFALIILKWTSGIKVSFHLKGRLANQEVLAVLSQARVYVGLSKSDGISTSLLEAMAMGAFPIQTGTSCASEWINSGSTGGIVSLGDRAELEGWVTRALCDDSLVNSAQAANRAKIQAEYTRREMTSKVENLYRRILVTL